MSLLLADTVAKSKIERRRKSRESRCLDVSTAAMLARPDTKVRGRFCVKRCGPSRRRVRTASAVLKNLFASQKRLFQQYRRKADVVWTRLLLIDVRRAP